jgi:plastocyanin
MNPRRSLSSLVGIACIALLLAACGGGGGGSATSSGSSTQTAAAGSTITISNFKFSPPTVTVKPGAGVIVTNEDGATHTASADDGSFDTGNLAQGQSRTISVTKSGTYSYHCAIHPYMHGTLVVK